MGSGLFRYAWRPLPEDNDEDMYKVKLYRPRNNEASHLRILLHGPVGAGKSSFINSVDSVLQGKVVGRALTDAASSTSFTKQYKTYKIHKDPDNFCSVVFNDITGFEKMTHNGVLVEDVILALKGHVRENYQFSPDQKLKNTDPKYNPDPTLDDRVHVLVSVIPVDSVSLLDDAVLKKLREVRLAASDMGIPQMAVLTKVDKACSNTKKTIKVLYRSKFLKEKVDLLSESLGIPPNCIFLVKNYESEITTNEGVDAPILLALRQMISYGEDFLNNDPQLNNNKKPVKSSVLEFFILLFIFFLSLYLYTP